MSGNLIHPHNSQFSIRPTAALDGDNLFTLPRPIVLGQSWHGVRKNRAILNTHNTKTDTHNTQKTIHQGLQQYPQYRINTRLAPKSSKRAVPTPRPTSLWRAIKTPHSATQGESGSTIPHPVGDFPPPDHVDDVGRWVNGL